MDDKKDDKPLRLVPSVPLGDDVPPKGTYTTDIPEEGLELPPVDLLDDPEQCVPAWQGRIKLTMQVLINGEPHQEFEPTFHFLQMFLAEHGVGCMVIRESEELAEKGEDLETLTDAMRQAYTDGHRFPEDLMQMLERLEAGERASGG